jgi:hypothetical protein
MIAVNDVRLLSIAALLVLASASAAAQESSGCDKFKWPLDKERATLNGTDLPKVNSGDRIPWPIPFAAAIGLNTFADAKLPFPPERAPKSPASFAGFVQVATPPKAATYKITLSSESWIDVVQNGHAVKSSAFSGAVGCAGLRKSVKFDLAAQPFTLQLSGAPADTIRVVVSSD